MTIPSGIKHGSEIANTGSNIASYGKSGTEIAGTTAASSTAQDAAAHAIAGLNIHAGVLNVEMLSAQIFKEICSHQ